jgi:hypothetical protein
LQHVARQHLGVRPFFAEPFPQPLGPVDFRRDGRGIGEPGGLDQVLASKGDGSPGGIWRNSG